MKQENTLYFAFILLILISFNANSEPISAQVRACNNAVNQSQPAAAIVQADRILEAEPNSHEGYICKARALGAQGQYDAALATFDLANQNAKEPFEHIITYMLIGNLQKDQQHYAEALTSYHKSLALCESEQNQKFQRINHNLLGDTHTLQHDFNGALAHYEAGEKLANNDEERAESYANLVATYRALNRYDLAIENQIRIVLTQERAGTLDDYAVANLVLGDIYFASKDYVNAEKTYRKLLKFSQDNGGQYYEAKSDLSIAKTQAAQGDTATARATLSSARQLASRIKANDLTQEIDTTEKNLAN